MTFLYILIGILLGIIILLSFALLLLLKKGKFFTKKEIDFIIFVIDMYTQYGEELDIHALGQHEKIVKELEKLKQKLNNYE